MHLKSAAAPQIEKIPKIGIASVRRHTARFWGFFYFIGVIRGEQPLIRARASKKRCFFWYSFWHAKSTNIQLFNCFMILFTSSLEYPSFSSSFRIALSLRPWLRRRAAL